jgi:hypothetical protein
MPKMRCLRLAVGWMRVASDKSPDVTMDAPLSGMRFSNRIGISAY